MRRIPSGSILAALVLASTFAASCSKAPAPAMTAASPPAAADRVFRRGNGADIDSLDPALTVVVEAGNIVRDVYEGLTELDVNGRAVPGVAERWDVSSDGLQYTFHLRPTARWANGEPVTAEDFVASWRRLVDPKTASPWGKFEFVENGVAINEGKSPVESLGVRAADAHTLIVALTGPAPFFPAIVAHWSTLPTYKGAPPAKPGETVSNGAFTLAEFVPNSHVLIRKNPQYWNAASVKLSAVRYVHGGDNEDEFRQFRAGELDLTSNTPGQPLSELRKSVGDQLTISPSLGIYYYGFNLARAPFDSKGLRQALSMAVDRDKLVNAVIAAGNRPAYSLLMAEMPDYTPQYPEWAAWPYEARVARARELYAKAGYSASRPLRFELRYSSGAVHERIALAVSAMWKETLGAEAKPVAEEFRSLLQTIGRGDVQMFRSGWSADFPDAYSMFSAFATDGPMNMSRYKDPTFRAALAASMREPDATKRRALLEAAERQFAEDAPIVPLYFMVNRRLIAPRVQGWAENPLRGSYSRTVELVD